MALRSYCDGALFAEVFGQSPPRVLAFHGWGRRGSDFQPSLAGLDAIAPDLPGFGASPPPVEAMGAEGYATMVAPLLDECAEPPVLVGHSFGGRVSVCLAARYPSRVRALVVTGAPLLRAESQTRPALSFRTMRMLNRVGLISDQRMETIRRRTGSVDYRAARGVMRDILVRVVNETYEEQLGRITSPVLLLWGAEDSEVPVSTGERANEILARSELRVLEGVGHLVPVDAPDELRALVDSQLA